MKKVLIKIAFKRVKSDSGFYSKLISKWTNSPFYHCEIIIDNKWISAVEGKGITINNLKPLNNNWDYKDLGIVDVCDKQYIEIFNWIERQTNKKYDWSGIIFSQVLPLRFHSSSKWFCSEIVTKLLQLFVVKESLDLEPHLTSPGDIARIFEVK